jgi:hypothetical protein
MGDPDPGQGLLLMKRLVSGPVGEEHVSHNGDGRVNLAASPGRHPAIRQIAHQGVDVGLVEGAPQVAQIAQRADDLAHKALEARHHNLLLDPAAPLLEPDRVAKVVQGDNRLEPAPAQLVDNAERDQIMNALKAKGIDSTNTAQVVVQRFKGLGEMNAEQLWETTMDPTKRTLLKVTVDDGAEADRTFDMLMGNSVPPRRNFITRHAREVRNLDV